MLLALGLGTAATGAALGLALALALGAALRRKDRADLGGQDMKGPFKVLFWDKGKNKGPTLHDLPSKQLRSPSRRN